MPNTTTKTHATMRAKPRPPKDAHSHAETERQRSAALPPYKTIIENFRFSEPINLNDGESFETFQDFNHKRSTTSWNVWQGIEAFLQIKLLGRFIDATDAISQGKNELINSMTRHTVEMNCAHKLAPQIEAAIDAHLTNMGLPQREAVAAR